MDASSTNHVNVTSCLQALQVNLFNRRHAIPQAVQQGAGQEVKDAPVLEALAHGMDHMKTYWGYSAATSTVDAVQMFKDRFGYVPQVTRTGGVVLCEIKDKEGEDELSEKLQDLQYELDI